MPSLRVVGIGASAGGLEPIRELLEELTTDSAMAFVIVQHLAPDQKSMLPDILSRSTKMPVVELTKPTTISANHVYVMSSGSDVEYSGGALLPRRRTGSKHMPVDRLFASLAEAIGRLAVGVILSGTDRDGTAGAQQIKAMGGVTFAQDSSAQFDGMPHAAIEKGAVDFVLPPREIARKLVELSRQQPLLPSSDRPELHRIIELLSTDERTDFLHYKTPTIERRIQRRMSRHSLEDISAYRRLLEDDPAERTALYRDILVGVTRFFRDPLRTETLKTLIFPRLLDGNPETLRFWVPACSTGEEAYSLAINFVEYLTEQKLTRSVQIFGSDLNDEAVAFARGGIYPESIRAAVTPERMRQFFTAAPGGGYSISRNIRDLCVFAEHDLLKDPPFSRLDLISCSNLLIYLQPAQQDRVAAIFNYSLNANGLLILGPSESLRPNAGGFIVVDKKRKVYRIAPGVRRRLNLSFRGPQNRGDAPVAKPFVATAAGEEPGRVVDRILLERYASPCVVVNQSGDVTEFRGDVQPFLAPASGSSSFKLSKLLHPDLLVHVRTALFKARQRGVAVQTRNVRMRRGDQTQFVNVEVLVSPSSAFDPVYVIAFEIAPSAQAETDRSTKSAGSQPETLRLQEELLAAREYLAHLTTEHEQSDTAFHTTSEELQSANEELQSTIEELETAKEELQSTNEELSTLNDELRVRNADLVVLGDDLMNLLSSIDTPVIMVDRDLVIRLFNPTAERLFSLRQSDVGRPLSAFKPLIELPDLQEILHRVMDAPTNVNSDVRSAEGHWYSLRVRPYRSSRNHIEGAVITLIDTHELRTALSLAEESRDIAEVARTGAERARATAIEANQLKDEFLSTLSHELRTPMTSILGWAQMMRMADLDEQTMATAVATIERGTLAQIRLIDDLLDISRITTGRLRLEQRSFRLGQLVEETLDVVRPAVVAKGITVRTEIDDAPMYGDPDRLRQVVWNVLSNAVKFTPGGGSIEVMVSRAKGVAVIRVSDTGVGIDPEFLPRVFDRFAQAESGSKRAKSGLGLGLAISKYVVDLHGGSIEATSAGLGQGSTFTVTLPLVAGVPHDDLPLPFSAGGAEFPRLEGSTVLIVDDDVDSLKLVGLALEQCGAAVIPATSVQEAMAVLNDTGPHLIISDIAMPAEDGIDFVRRVRALPAPTRDVPMIALTAFTSEDDRRRTLNAGFNDYIPKPIAPMQLMRAVAGWVDPGISAPAKDPTAS